MRAEHWPGGRPARAWAEDVVEGRAQLADVPQALRAMVEHYVRDRAERTAGSGPERQRA